MADREKKERKTKIQKHEYLKSKKSFLDEIKTFFIVFEGLSFGENKKLINNFWQTLKELPVVFILNHINNSLII